MAFEVISIHIYMHIYYIYTKGKSVCSTCAMHTFVTVEPLHHSHRVFLRNEIKIG